jgi:hypothetical protein
VSAVMAAASAGVPLGDEVETAPKPVGRWALLPAVLVAVAALLLVVGAGMVVLPSVIGRPAATAPPTGEEVRAWRVSDRDSVLYLDNMLQSGWRVERADTDNWGTTYVVRRPQPAGEATAQ